MGVRFDDSRNEVRLYDLCEPEERRGTRKPVRTKRKKRQLQQYRQFMMMQSRREAMFIDLFRKVCFVLFIEFCMAYLLLPGLRFEMQRVFVHATSAIYKDYQQLVHNATQTIVRFQRPTSAEL